MLRTLERRRRRGFTLLELVVGVVVLSVLAAIAVPAYNTVTTKSRLHTAESTLGSILRATQAETALGSTPDFGTVSTIVGQTPASLAGNPRSWMTALESTSTNPNPSTTPDVVSVYYDGTTITGIAVAVTGGCALGRMNGNALRTWNENVTTLCTGIHAAGVDPNPAVVIAPSVPQSLVAEITSGTAAFLRWQAPSSNGGAEVTSYRIITTAGGTPRSDETKTLSALEFQDGDYSISLTDLTPGVQYGARVAAINSAGPGSYAGPVSFNTDVLVAPAVPQDIIITPGDTQLSVSWSMRQYSTIAPITGYRLYADNSLGIPEIVGTSSGLSATLTGLTNGETYTLSVASYGPGGESARSTTATEMPFGNPITITGLTAQSGSGYAALSWDALTSTSANPVTSIEILRNSTVVTTVAYTTTNFVMTGLGNGSTYSVGVRPKSASRTGAASTTSVSLPLIPNTPESLDVTTGDSEVLLTWAAVPSSIAVPISGYKIYRMGGVVPDFIGAVSGTTQTVTALTNGTPYTFSVTAYGSTGESEFATEISATPIAAPQAPIEVTPSTVNRGVALNWSLNSSAAAPITSVKVYQNGTRVATLSAVATSYTATDLTPGQEYNFQIESINAVGASRSTTTNFTVTGTSAAPTGLAATPDSGQVTLSWSPVASSAFAPVTGYNVYKTANGIEEWVNATSTPSYVAQDLTNGTPYTFSVAAYGVLGEGQRSSSVTSTPVTTPVAITGLSATRGDNSATLSWNRATSTDDAPVTRIEVLVDSTVVANVSYQVTTRTVTGLSAGSTHTLSVRPLNDTATGPSTSIEVEIVTLPGTPSGLTATSSDAAGTLIWNAVAPTTAAPLLGYRVYDNSNGYLQFVGAGSGTTFEFSGLTNGSSYSYRVASYGPAGESAVSASVTVTPFGVPANVTELSATNNGDLSVVLVWTAPISTSSSPVSYIDVLDGSTVVASLANNATTYTFSDLAAGSDHTFGVRTRNAASRSATLSVETTVTQAPAAPAAFTVTPGNASAILNWSTVTSSSTSPVTGYRVFKVQNGFPSLITATASTSINVSDLTNGTPVVLEVAAYGPAGEGVHATAPAVTPLGTPATITGLGATRGDSTATLTWTSATSTAAAPVTEIEVLVNGSPITSVSNTTTTHTFTGLTVGTTYALAVRPKNPINTGASSSSSVTIIRLPSAPSGITATAGDSQVSLSWLSSSSGTEQVTGYMLYQYNATTSLYEFAGSTATTTYTVTALTNGESYSFKIAAYGPVGEGLRSASVSATPISLPDSITGLTYHLTDQSVSIDWAAASFSTSSPVDSLEVLKDGAVVSTLASSATSYIYSGLVAGTTYVLGVRPVNDLGHATSTTASVKAQTIPSAPGGFTATAQAASVALNWNAVADSTAASVSGYSVYQYNPGTSLWEIAGSSATTSFSVTSLTNATSYSFRVSAYGPAGEGARSGTASATPLGAPAQIYNLVATVASKSIGLTWDAPTSTTESPVTSVDVLLNGEVYENVTPGTLSANITGLTAGTTYSVSVRPKNDVSTGAPTSLSVLALDVPPTPASLSTTAGNATVNLSWSGVTGTSGAPVSGYNIYRLVNGVMTLAGSTSSLTYDVTSLTNGTQYTFTVAAYGTAGEGGRHANVNSTPVAPPAQIANLQGTTGSATVDLTWDALTTSVGSPLTGYNVYKYAAGIPVLVGSTAGATYAVTGLTNGNTYTFEVAAYGPGGEGARSSSITSTLPDLPASITLDSVYGGNAQFKVNFSATASVSQPISGFRVYVNGTSVKTLANTATSGTVVSGDVSSGGLVNGTPITVQVSAYNSSGEAFSSIKNHIVGQVQSAAVPTSGTAFPNNDIFQLFGNSFNESFPGTWSNPTVSGMVTASSSTRYGTTSLNGPTDHVNMGGANAWGATSSAANWMQWDFGAGRSVTPKGIMLNWGNYSWDTSLEGSNDGTTWSMLWQIGANSTRDVATTTIAPVSNTESYRYLRIYKHSVPHTGWFSINEAQIFGTVNLYSVPTPWTTTAAGTVLPGADQASVQDGQYLYILGGHGGSNTIVNTMKRYDMASGTFATMANVPYSATSKSAVLYNNKIYLFGGANGTTYNNNMYVYDIGTDTWSTLGSGLGRQFNGMSAIVSGSAIYAFGGYNATYKNTAYKFDLTTNTWSTLLTMPVSRGGMTPMLNSSGDIILMGGIDSTGYSQSSIYKYSRANNDYTLISYMITPRAYTTGTVLPDGRLFIAGGYYVSANVWTSLGYADMMSADTALDYPSQATSTAQAGAAIGYYNNRVYVVGGIGTAAGLPPVNVVQVRDVPPAS